MIYVEENDEDFDAIRGESETSYYVGHSSSSPGLVLPYAFDTAVSYRCFVAP